MLSFIADFRPRVVLELWLLGRQLWSLKFTCPPHKVYYFHDLTHLARCGQAWRL